MRLGKENSVALKIYERSIFIALKMFITQIKKNFKEEMNKTRSG